MYILRLFDCFYTLFINHGLRTRLVPGAEFGLGSYYIDLLERW